MANNIQQHLKSAMWTGAEAIVLTGGAVIANRVLDERKLFAKEFAQNPLWFEGARSGAPFKIQWYGAIIASAAAVASTYVQNVWLKLALMGVVLFGVLRQAQIVTYKPGQPELHIGQGEKELDEKLKKLAQEYRTSGVNPTNEYSSTVASPENPYSTTVAGETDDNSVGFSHTQEDSTTVGEWF